MASPIRPDRRHQRRRETIEQVLDTAVDVMADQGVAGLTLGEVARRMGIRPPSLYGYFDGKHALYDALFERGWRELSATMHDAHAGFGTDDLVVGLFERSTAFVRWAVEHPAYAPLMFWRPVPGFSPSATAYTPAVELADYGRDFLRQLRDGGVLAADADLDAAWTTYTAVLSGIVSQQLSNAPGEPFVSGTFTRTLPDVVAMWLAHYRGPVLSRPAPPS